MHLSKTRFLITRPAVPLKACRPFVCRSSRFSTAAPDDTTRINPNAVSQKKSSADPRVRGIESIKKKERRFSSKDLSNFLTPQPSSRSKKSLPPNRPSDQSRSSRISFSKSELPPTPSAFPPGSHQQLPDRLPSDGTSYQFSEPRTAVTVSSRPYFAASSRALWDKNGRPESMLFTVTCPSLNIDRTTFSARWARDSDVSLCSVDASTRQKKHQSDEPDPIIRLIDDSPAQQPVTLKSVSELRAMGETVAAELGPCLKFQWQGTGLRKNTQFARELAKKISKSGVYSLVPLAYLSSAKEKSPLVPKAIPWAASDLDRLRTLWTSYEDFKSKPQALHTVLRQLATHGIAFIRNVPTEHTDNEKCELRALANRVGELRHTFYGETWDVRSLGDQGRNVAYTDVPLGLHMDLLYFQNPPQLQFLHSLRARAEGGASYFVDSFRAAENIRQHKPDVFQKLTRAKVPYHYINDAHHLEHSHPVIELQPPSKPVPFNRAQSRDNNRALGSIKHVNYSPPFQAPFPHDLNPSEVTMDALTTFAKELRDPKLVFELMLKEGECVVFDNRRVLHARRGFKEVEEDGPSKGPQRWLKGCYVDGDAAWDRLRVLESEKRRGEW